MILQTVRIVRELNPTLRTLFFTTLIFRAGTMAFPFLAAYLVTQGDYSGGAIGAVVAAFGVGALVADLLAGPVLSLVPARAVILGGLLLTCAMLATVPLVTAVPLLVAATFLWGFGYEIFTPAVYAETIAHSTEAERKVAFSCNRLAINIGMGIGPSIGGLIFALLPTSLFVVNSVVTALAGLQVLFFWRAGSGERGRSRDRHAFRLFAETRQGEARFWTIFGLTIPITIAYALPPTLLSAYLIHDRGLSSIWVSAVFFFNAGIVVLFEVPLNNAMRQVSHFAALTSGFLLAGLGFALMALAGSPVVLMLSTLVWTAGEMIVFPSLLHYVSEVSDPSVTGRNMGLFSATVNLGLIMAPQISLALVGAYGPATPWYVAGGTILAALLIIVGIRNNSFVWLAEEQPVPARPVAE